VGKSTLISVISAARPKIANYPFTTLEPNLGVVRMQGLTEFVVADIPGLIEGASEGKGLGHKFLKHIERARVLCVMLDLSDPESPSPQEQERILLRELGQYQPDLLDRPRLSVGTKSDSAIHDWDGDVISSITNQGVRELVQRMSELVFQARQQQPESEGIVIIRPHADGARVERLDEHEYRLVGRQVERVVALNDVTTPEALNYIDYQLKRIGVPKMLAKAGAIDGDIVWIAGFSFEYHEEV
jgi:GTP-binding protein